MLLNLQETPDFVAFIEDVLHDKLLCNVNFWILYLISSLVRRKFLKMKCQIKALREKCPNMELFSVCIFLYSVGIQEDTDQKVHIIWILFTKMSTLTMAWIPHSLAKLELPNATRAFSRLLKRPSKSRSTWPQIPWRKC